MISDRLPVFCKVGFTVNEIAPVYRPDIIWNQKTVDIKIVVIKYPRPAEGTTNRIRGLGTVITYAGLGCSRGRPYNYNIGIEGIIG